MKLTKREIAWHYPAGIRVAAIYIVENLPPGHTADMIEVQKNEWRVSYTENDVTSEWEDHYPSADAALEAIERLISQH
jgi:hypothetical protein